MKAEGRRIVCLTAYDTPSARLADEQGVDLVLVGDSVANAALGLENTLGVTLEAMVHHTAAVARGVEHALVVADLPFGSYQASAEDAVNSSVALVRAGAGGVKLEGDYPEAVSAIVRAGIPVMGHVGMTPQAIHALGGFRVQGRAPAERERIREQVRALEQAGCFAIVLELILDDLAAEITEASTVPTIGIGAGPHCDGQIQVWHDILGLSSAVYKHARVFADCAAVIRSGLSQYVDAVRSGNFPPPRERA